MIVERTLPATWHVTAPRWLPVAGVLALGGVLLALHRPATLLSAQFLAEEGGQFYVPTFFYAPHELVFASWGGYLNVLPRLLYGIVGAVPPYWAPLVENLLAGAAVIALAAFIASRRMAAVVPDARLRLMLAALLVLMPAQSTTFGTTLTTQTYLVLWLAALTVVPDPISRLGQWAERVGVAIGSLSGPYAVALAPLFLWRVRMQHRPWLAGIVTVGAIVQVVVIVLHPRPIGGLDAPLLTAVTAPNPLAAGWSVGHALSVHRQRGAVRHSGRLRIDLDRALARYRRAVSVACVR